MGLLIRELVPMEVGETKEIKIPIEKDTLLRATKHERDSLSGELIQDNKKIAEFLHRSIPGIGLVLLSALELYNLDDLEKPEVVEENTQIKIQSLIDERLALHDLIGQVVDKKVMHKEAIHQLVLAKLTEAIKLVDEKARMAEAKAEIACINAGQAQKLAQENEVKLKKKPSPVQQFLEKRKSKKEFSIVMAKSETIQCPDCKASIFDKTGFNCCLCYGSDMGRKVFLKKTENGIKVSFPKSWDPENIEMLLEVLKKK
jgi:hypothetical protein